MSEKLIPQEKAKQQQQVQLKANEQEPPVKQMAPPPFQLKADPIQLEDGKGPQLTPPILGGDYARPSFGLGIPSLQGPMMVPPLTANFMPPVSGGATTPATPGFGLVPPLSANFVPRLSGAGSSLVPPFTGAGGSLLPPLGAGFQPTAPGPLAPQANPLAAMPPLAQDDIAFVQMLRGRLFGVSSQLLSDDAVLSMSQVDPLAAPFEDADGLPRRNADGTPMTQWSQLSPAQVEEQARISRLIAQRRRFNLGWSGPINGQGLGASYQWADGRSLSMGVLPVTNAASSAPAGLDGAKFGLDYRF